LFQKKCKHGEGLNANANKGNRVKLAGFKKHKHGEGLNANQGHRSAKNGNRVKLAVV
jgi:hypothetical protein